MLEAKGDIVSEARNFLSENFSDFLVYSAFTGSAVYGGAMENKSDLDWFIVVKENFFDQPASLKAEFRRKFTDFYYYLNLKYKFKPDDDWPGEIISIRDIEMAIQGQGVYVDYKKVLKGESQYDEKSLIVSYYIWLCYSAMSKYIIGDEEIFKNNKQRAWDKIVSYSSEIGNFNPVTYNDVLQLVKGKIDPKVYFGWKETYYDFDSLEKDYLISSLEYLKSKKEKS